MKGPSDAASADGKSTRWRAKRTSPPLLLFSLFSAFPASSASLDRLLGEVRCFCFVGGGEWGRYERGMVGNRGFTFQSATPLPGSSRFRIRIFEVFGLVCWSFWSDGEDFVRCSIALFCCVLLFHVLIYMKHRPRFSCVCYVSNFLWCFLFSLSSDFRWFTVFVMFSDLSSGDGSHCGGFKFFFFHNYVGRILSLSIWKLLRSVLEKYMCNMSALKYMCNMSALMVYNTESNAQR